MIFLNGQQAGCEGNPYRGRLMGGGDHHGLVMKGGAAALGGEAGLQSGDPNMQGAIAQVMQLLQSQGKLDLGDAGGDEDGGMQMPKMQMPQQSSQAPPASSGGAPAKAEDPKAQGPQPPDTSGKDKGDGAGMEMPKADDKRPPGDNRSAQDIIDGDPNLKNLGNQGDTKGPANPDGGGLRDGLKKQCGDFEHDPDAAYRASKVLEYIKSSKDREGGERDNSQIHNGKIDGITKSGDARHGTEAGMLQDFGKNGYSALPQNHQLDKTKDSHVKLDGTNKDNFQWALGQIGKGFKWWPLVGNMLDKMSNSTGGVGGMLKAGAKSYANTLKHEFISMAKSIARGKISPINLAMAAGKGQAMSSDEISDKAKGVIDKLPI